MTEVESLISSNQFNQLEDLVQQLVRCLTNLHAKVDQSRELIKSSDSVGLQALDSELIQIKMEVKELKRRLVGLEPRKRISLAVCMTELDQISFSYFAGLTRGERSELQAIYDNFKDVMREGEDGAPLLMHLVMRVKEYEEKKAPGDRTLIAEQGSETLTKIFDLYASVFPAVVSSETKEVAEKPVGSTKHERVVVEKPWGKPPSETLYQRSGGGRPGDGGSGDDGRGGNDSDGDTDDEHDGTSLWFLLVFGGLLFAVALLILLPEDKSKVLDGSQLAKIKDWFLKITGQEPPPPEPTRRRRRRRKV